MEIFKLVRNIIQMFQGGNTLPQTRTTFKAFVETVVPETHGLAEEQKFVHSFGALDLRTDEYEIWILDHFVSLKLILKNFNIYLANSTAEMLNAAAEQLVSTGGNDKPVNSAIVSEKGMFAALEAPDRCRTITRLEHLQVDLAGLPVPFRKNPEIVLAMVSILTMLATNGYYSEWSGCGSTRLESPGQRKIEFCPTSWKQIGYPGPSKGYHALRGYLVNKFTE